MTLREYKEYLDHYILNNDDMLDKQVCYSSDDEGNFYHPVIFKPTRGKLEDGEFMSDKRLSASEINATCIN